MKIFFCFLFVLMALSGSGQNLRGNRGEIYDVVEVQPEFPGGTKEMYRFIGTSFIYPDTCIKLNVQGKVYVSFIVEKDGSIDEAFVLRGVHPELDKEALRVISSMPRWKPGQQRGKPVRVRYTIPIVCKLN